DRNRSHWSTSKTPSYTKSVSWQHHHNLTLRTRIKRLGRKTICFSRSVEIHEKVIGAFIEKHMFY
ncbi:IS1 family transposase, partial [Escherichia coli]|uniref:IS1 family transposase n=1 Tax=Escherichia coli TaxID=562 RepID=UPI001CED7400